MRTIEGTTHDINTHEHGTQSREGDAQPKQGKDTTKPTKPKTREADRMSTTSNIFRANTGDTASKQDDAFKKGNGIVTSSPSDPMNQT